MSRREQRITQMRDWLQNVPESAAMIGAALRKNKVATVAEFAERHPKQFNSLYEAIATMEEELPEPGFPWPKV